ncbi:FMN-dependent 2-nitropropane dioxygenase [Xylariomycetidae sp. FL0641]|nr:FMN-dependent 2-nitropropane dioxygenase [Xylariomycetidae sp. FL0641]
MATAKATRMKAWFPGTESPLVVSAPMDFVVNPRLATEVVKAGGFGFIQGGRDFAPNSPVLAKLDDQLTQSRRLLDLGPQDTVLPLGVGFVTYAASTAHFAETTLPVLARHRPAAVWLFAPSPEIPHTQPELIAALKKAGREWGLKVAVQVGTVAAARDAAAHGADIVVAQAMDAGGHQFVAGAGLVSLVPEVADMLRDEFPGREIAVWAAGGIADGRGVAACLCLGAEAAVVGTRYMVATESDAQDFKRKAILSTSDGAANTAKSQFHDHIQGNREWPDIYDGRAVVHPSLQDHHAGTPFDDNIQRFKAAKEAGDHSRMVTWSGTAVGLIKREQPAAEITKEIRDGAIKAAQAAARL